MKKQREINENTMFLTKFPQTTERNRHKRPSKTSTNDRTKPPQTTERNRHKRPNKTVTNDRKLV